MNLGKNMKKVFRVYHNETLVREGFYQKKNQIVRPDPQFKGVYSARSRIIHLCTIDGTFRPGLTYEIRGHLIDQSQREILIYKFWVKDGMLINQDEGPGFISYTLEGEICEEQWFIDGRESSIQTPYSSRVRRKSGAVRTRWLYGNEDITQPFADFLNKADIEVDSIDKTDIDVFILERGITK